MPDKMRLLRLRRPRRTGDARPRPRVPPGAGAKGRRRKRRTAYALGRYAEACPTRRGGAARGTERYLEQTPGARAGPANRSATCLLPGETIRLARVDGVLGTRLWERPGRSPRDPDVRGGLRHRRRHVRRERTNRAADLGRLAGGQRPLVRLQLRRDA